MDGATYLVLFIPLLFGFIHGLLFAGMLMYRGIREERQSDLFLAALVCSGCLLLLPTILGLLDIHVLWNEWLFLPLDPGLLIGPLLYFFILSQTNRSFRFRHTDIWHFVPFMVYAIYHMIVFSQGTEVIFIWMDKYDLPYIDPVYKLITLVIMTGYLILSVKIYVSYRKWVEHEYVSPGTLRFPWITRLLFAIGIAVLATCIFRLSEAMSMDMDYVQAWWTSAIVTLSIYYISIAGLFSKRPPENPQKHAPDGDGNKDSAGPSLYTQEELTQWLVELTELMEKRHVYLNPELSLGNVAKELGLSRKNVSTAINAQHGTNFRRFVNEYRVQSFKKLVSNGRAEEMTLYGLALDCGFNSKATFNRVFKQIEGMAPNEYAKKIKQSTKST